MKSQLTLICQRKDRYFCFSPCPLHFVSGAERSSFVSMDTNVKAKYTVYNKQVYLRRRQEKTLIDQTEAVVPTKPVSYFKSPHKTQFYWISFMYLLFIFYLIWCWHFLFLWMLPFDLISCLLSRTGVFDKGPIMHILAISCQRNRFYLRRWGMRVYNTVFEWQPYKSNIVKVQLKEDTFSPWWVEEMWIFRCELDVRMVMKQNTRLYSCIYSEIGRLKIERHISPQRRTNLYFILFFISCRFILENNSFHLTAMIFLSMWTQQAINKPVADVCL